LANVCLLPTRNILFAYYYYHYCSSPPQPSSLWQDWRLDNSLSLSVSLCTHSSSLLGQCTRQRHSQAPLASLARLGATLWARNGPPSCAGGPAVLLPVRRGQKSADLWAPLRRTSRPPACLTACLLRLRVANGEEKMRQLCSMITNCPLGSAQLRRHLPISPPASIHWLANLV